MSKVTLTQFSFNRGELDPALCGRSDWKYYYSGAEKLLNMITRPQGGAAKRGGLRMVTPALDDDKPSQLIPFRFSVRQSYMLEFGDRRMRVIKDGGVVLYPEGHERAGEEAILETPYPSEALPQLRYTQTADVMILTHADHPPRRLARHAHHDWRFSLLVANSLTASPEGLRIADVGGGEAKYLVTALTEESGESPPSAIVADPNPERIAVPDSGRQFSVLYNWLRDRDYSFVPEDLAFHSMDIDAMIAFLRGCGYRDHGRGLGNNRHGWWWGHVKPDGTGEELTWLGYDLYELHAECLHACNQGWPGNVKQSLITAVEHYVDDYNASLPRAGATGLEWNPVAGARAYRVYRRSPLGSEDFLLIGETETTRFTDDDLPDGDTVLPATDGVFSGLDDYPAVCAFFEQRLVLGRTDNQPTTFWGSETGVYNSFAAHTPVEDTDSYEFTLASGEMNEIHWIVPLNDLLFGTSGGEWKAGGGGSVVTPANVNARVQSWYGCSPLSPVVVGRTVIFAGRSRRTVRTFTYSLEADGYAGRDLTAYASHLFAGRTVAGMCYQQEPSGIVWVVMSDGSLLSCTYAPEEDVVAWSRHATRGSFESCGSLVDVDGTDQVYFCVAREVGGVTRRFVETLEDAADAVADETEAFFLDCGLTYRGGPAGKVYGLEHLEGELVSCLADGSVFSNLAVRDGMAELPGGFKASVIHVGLPYAAELATVELEPEDKETLRNRARFIVSAAVRFVNSRECLYGHSGGGLCEMKFRTTEPPGLPVRLFTGEKDVVFSSPPGARTTRLRFVSESPVPFAVSGIVAEAGYGQPA